MSAYAITADGFRAVGDGEELQPGESLVDVVPDELLLRIAEQRGRSERNQLLRASDWTQAPDVPLSEEERTAWGEYRQALRDLPLQPDFPDCTWPVPLPTG